jgi:hypothetical protein
MCTPISWCGEKGPKETPGFEVGEGGFKNPPTRRALRGSQIHDVPFWTSGCCAMISGCTEKEEWWSEMAEVTDETRAQGGSLSLTVGQDARQSGSRHSRKREPLAPPSVFYE